MKPQYRFDAYEYPREFFRRMTKEKRHLPFRQWLRKYEFISKGMNISSYTPDYMVPLFKEFERQRLLGN